METNSELYDRKTWVGEIRGPSLDANNSVKYMMEEGWQDPEIASGGLTGFIWKVLGNQCDFLNKKNDSPSEVLALLDIFCSISSARPSNVYLQ